MLFFSLPDGASADAAGHIAVDLSADARRRFSEAEVRYRRTSQSVDQDRDSDLPHVTRAQPDSTPQTSASGTTSQPTRKRRVAVNEDGSPVSGPGPDPQQ